MGQTEYEDGDVVEVLKDGSRGIVVGQSPKYLNVLFDGYIAVPVAKSRVMKLNKHFDLKKFWESLYEI